VASSHRLLTSSTSPSHSTTSTTTMRATNINGNPDLFLEYDTFGLTSNPPILLIMGLACQMIEWRPAFCELLASKGFYVIRFDNRDIGLSSHFDALGAPPLVRRIVTAKIFGGGCISTPYTLEEMADDAAGLLAYLKLPAAHVVGVSMGGMISQTFAINHTEKCLSLCSIMSTTGQRWLAEADSTVSRLLLAKPQQDFEGRVAATMKVLTAISHPSKPSSDLKQYIELAVNRSYHPVGASRQLNAIAAQKDRRIALGQLKVKAPTLPCAVIHGRGDKLVKLPHGEATAHALGGDVTFHIVEGMGHVIVEHFNDEVVGVIAKNATRREVVLESDVRGRE
jgi:pimeloyl-ACP methyl ester carboxylesterase